MRGWRQTTVGMVCVDIARQRPPLAALLCDMTLTNAEGEPRWFLLPDEFPPIALPGETTLESIVYRLTGTGAGTAVVGHALGPAGFRALLLPGGRPVTASVSDRYLDDPPAVGAIDILVAAQLTIGGEPAAAWFGMEPLCDAGADVAAAALGDQAGVVFADPRPREACRCRSEARNTCGSTWPRAMRGSRAPAQHPAAR